MPVNSELTRIGGIARCLCNAPLDGPVCLSLAVVEQVVSELIFS